MTDKKYLEAEKMVALHRKFDLHITSFDIEQGTREGDLINMINKKQNPNDWVETLVRNELFVPREFDLLNKDLIKQSLEENLFFMKMISEVNWYETCLLKLIDNKEADEQGENDVDLLIKSLNESSKFHWSNLSELEQNSDIKALKEKAFPNLPTHYVVKGILDYSDYCETLEDYSDYSYDTDESEKSKPCPKKFREEFVSSSVQQFNTLDQYWRNTRDYDHDIHKDFMLAERMDWGEVEQITQDLYAAISELKFHLWLA